MSKIDKLAEAIGTIVIAIVALGGVLIIAPIIGVIFGWFAGTVLKWFFGDYIANGLNLIFNTTRFASNQLPMICASLGVIGSYFRANQTNKK